MCDGTGRTALIRIACHELEAWYFGDLEAVSAAYGKDLSGLKRKSMYRIPDKIENPKQELRKYIPEHQQILGAKLIGEQMEVERNTSVSFQMLVSGLKRLCDEND